MSAKAESFPPISFDAFSPKDIAARVQKAGVAKANLNVITMFALAVLAGSFIGLGAEFCTLAITGIDIGFGLTKVLGGLVFSLGLILVVVAGAELFTGNNLLTIAWVSGKAPFSRVARNWVVVFLGNLAGSLAMAGLMFLTRQWSASSYGVGVTALKIAAGKTTLPFMTALSRGVLCNILVCLAVWLCFSSRSVADKILAIIFPITAFVASGFEHSIANMYFIPYGILLKSQPDVVAAAGLSSLQLDSLTLAGFLNNLVPVTIGNMIGGGIMVGAMYWFIYLRHEQKIEQPVSVLEPSPVPRPLMLLPEGIVMKTNPNQAPPVQLYSFTIASGDMFYSEMNQRVIYMQDDSDSGFHIWGEIPGGAGITASDLSEVLLEYAMTASASSDLPGAYRQMDTFGKKLGESLAVRIMQSTPAESAEHRAACALECVLEALDVHFTVEQTGGQLSYALDFCPLCAKAEQTGIRHVELAHHGLTALCSSLIHAFDPELAVRMPARPGMNHILFSVLVNGQGTLAAG